MKKTLVLLALSMSMALTGCGYTYQSQLATGKVIKKSMKNLIAQQLL